MATIYNILDISWVRFQKIFVRYILSSDYCLKHDRENRASRSCCVPVLKKLTV